MLTASYISIKSVKFSFFPFSPLFMAVRQHSLQELPIRMYWSVAVCAKPRSVRNTSVESINEFQPALPTLLSDFGKIQQKDLYMMRLSVNLRQLAQGTPYFPYIYAWVVNTNHILIIRYAQIQCTHYLRCTPSAIVFPIQENTRVEQQVFCYKHNTWERRKELFWQKQVPNLDK
jgi:hypothetical protein